MNCKGKGRDGSRGIEMMWKQSSKEPDVRISIKSNNIDEDCKSKSKAENVDGFASSSSDFQAHQLPSNANERISTENPPASASPSHLGTCTEPNDQQQWDENDPKNKKKIEFIWLGIVIVVAYVCSISVLLVCGISNEMRKIKFLGFELWKWILLLVMMQSSTFFCSYIPRVIGYLIGRDSRSRFSLRMLALGGGYVTSNIIFSWICWICLSFIICRYSVFRDGAIISKTASKILHYVTNNVIAFLICSLLWLFKTQYVIKIASKYQVQGFLDRSLEVMFNKYLVKALSGPPQTPAPDTATDTVPAPDADTAHAHAPAPATDAAAAAPTPATAPTPETAAEATSTSFSSSSYLHDKYLAICSLMGKLLLKRINPVIAESSSTISQGTQGLRELGAWVKQLRERRGSGEEAYTSDSTMSFLINHIINAELSIIHNPGDKIKDQIDFKITNEQEAKNAAHRIFTKVAKPGCKYIDKAALLRILQQEDVDSLLFRVKGSSGKIGKKALTHWMVKAFMDQKALTSCSKYTDKIVEQLNQTVAYILTVVLFLLWFLLMQLPGIRVLISLLLGASFIFGNTCKNVFESVIFFIAMHPFDVGDVCVVDEKVLRVEEGDIFTTVFLKLDNNEKVFYPNSVLATKPISNYKKSPEMRETVEFTVDTTTAGPPTDQIEFLRRRIRLYLKSKHKLWQPDFSLEVKDISKENKLRLVLNCLHRTNFQNLRLSKDRRSKLEIELKKLLEELKMVEFTFDIADPTEYQIEFLKKTINSYLSSSEPIWRPDFVLQVKEIENEEKLRMVLNFSYKTNLYKVTAGNNSQIITERNNQKIKLAIDLKKILQELKIVKVTVDIAKPATEDKIELLKQKIQEYLQSEPRLWRSDFVLEVTEKHNMGQTYLDAENKIWMVLSCCHKKNFQNQSDRNIWQTKLATELMKILKEQRIEFYPVDQQPSSSYGRLKSTKVSTEQMSFDDDAVNLWDDDCE